MELVGTIVKVYYKNSNWASIRVKVKDRMIQCSGKIIEPMEGCSILMSGDFFEDSKYGLQFKVDSSIVKMPASKIGIEAYLGSGLIKGIGSAMAARIVERFGDETLTVIELAPERLLEIKGISKKKKDSIVECHKNNSQLFALFDLLGGQITINQAKKILDKYGNDKAVEKIKKNPYSLIYDIDGIGFSKADSIAKAMKIKEDSMLRVGAACYYVLQKSENFGHCYLDMETIQEEVIKLLCPIKSLPVKIEKKLYELADDWEKEKESFIKKNKMSSSLTKEIEDWLMKREHYLDILATSILNEVECNHIVIDEDRIYTHQAYEAETVIAEIVAKLSKSKPLQYITLDNILDAIEDIENTQEFSLGEQQKNAVKGCLQHRISIITGGPGRGKTTIIRTIIRAWDDDKCIVCCAPTGRAAQRMKEATGHQAFTIQRMLVTKRMEGVNRETLSKTLFIVDESSMIDIFLAKEFLKFAQHSTVIFVGDVDQLPSIGPGTFFRDMVENTHVATYFLVEGYRNFGSIAQNSMLANNGKGLKDFIFDKFAHFEEVDKENIQDRIVSLYKEKLKTYSLKDVCILVPMRQKSNSGSTLLNTIIRDTINPKTEENVIPDINYRLNDRIMETSNNPKEPVVKDGVPDFGVYNGDCGIITDYNDEDGTIEITFDDGRIAYYEKYKMENLQFCYAMTIHKSQGSEYPCVIIAANREHYIMLKRKLLYTAITRAKKELYLLGNESAYNMAVRNVVDDARNTYLQKRINSFF